MSDTDITVNNNSINAPAGQEAYAAIDTGTTLVGGPPAAIAEVFAQIPGAQPGTGDFESYYTYRERCPSSPRSGHLVLTAVCPACDTQVTLELAFGGRRSWSISPADFELARLMHDTCLGALFEITSGGSAPAWIVGDTFLVRDAFGPLFTLFPMLTLLMLLQKNVYSVFRYSPAAVGFAELSTLALSMNGAQDAAVPSATIGSSAAMVMATGSPSRGGSNRNSGTQIEKSLVAALSLPASLSLLLSV